MSAVIPQRSLSQRQEALLKANDHRIRRARLKRDVKAGRVRVVPLIVTVPVPEWLESMKVYDLLLAMPGWGQVKLDRAFRRASVSHSKTLGGMTWRQRDDLLRELGL